MGLTGTQQLRSVVVSAKPQAPSVAKHYGPHSLVHSPAAEPADSALR